MTAFVTRVHQIWLQGEDQLPDKYKPYVAKHRKLHPDYKLWDEKSIRQLIEEQYPEMLDTYLSFPYWVQRVDLAKYVILHHEGGLYTDMDLQPLQSYLPLMMASNGLPTFYLKKVPKMWRWIRDPFLNNNWLYSPYPNHPLMRQLVDYTKASSVRMIYDVKIYYILNSTGPQYMMEIVRRFVNTGGKITLFTEDVTNNYFKDEEAGTWITKWFDKSDKWTLGALAVWMVLIILTVRFCHVVKRVK